METKQKYSGLAGCKNEVEKLIEKTEAKPKYIEVKVQYLVSNKADDHYVTDEDGDYDTERLVGGSWTTQLVTETIELSDEKQVNAIFDAEDGDYDYDKSLQLITDGKDVVLYNPKPNDKENAIEYKQRQSQFRYWIKNKIRELEPKCAECGGEIEWITEHTSSSNGDGYGKTEGWGECKDCREVLKENENDN